VKLSSGLYTKSVAENHAECFTGSTPVYDWKTVRAGFDFAGVAGYPMVDLQVCGGHSRVRAALT
jgi:hypothetical protein